MADLSQFKQVDEVTWEIGSDFRGDMNVPVRIIATEDLLSELDQGAVDQLINVSTLQGIDGYSFAMPDSHWGYGAPVGSVFATDPENEGVISPGAIGFDINCGMRLIRTDLSYENVKPKLERLIDDLFATVPTGVGSSGALRNLSKEEMTEVMKRGAKFCVDKGGGWESDIKHSEDEGCIEGADPEAVSGKAIDRGKSQLGTLGSGNHYLEIQVLKKENIYDWDVAEELGLFPNQIVIMIHTGSRGFGHQICTDYLDFFESAMDRYNISVPDDQLACAPINSQEGKDYYSAMAAAANFAFANRQTITHKTREVFADLFDSDPKDDLQMELIYDVAHNIAKKEMQPNGKELLVHRKGATRAFGPDNSEIPKDYQNTGQPVIIGGSMETGSALLVGTKKAEEKTFGSTAHGSGRTMSRNQAKKKIHGKDKQREMKQKGIKVKAADMAVLAEESGFAYKDLDDVISTVSKAKISRPVAKLTPAGNIKG
ncbi:MAG: RtcB family protein [Candidatus Magasanikbacteria bacterium]